MKLSLPISLLALAIACYALFVAEGERRARAEQEEAGNKFFNHKDRPATGRPQAF